MPSDLTLKEPILPAPQQSKEDAMRELAGINPLQPEIDLLTGAAIGPFTLAPDTVGLLFDTIEATTGFASEYVYGDKRGQVVMPDFNGDPIREAVNLNPDSGWGMVGEALGGWENALAKGGTAAAKLFTQAVQQAPDAVMASIFGYKGARAIGGAEAVATGERAAARLDAGDNPATVLFETGWYRETMEDGTQKMKFLVSDVNTKLDERLLTERFGHAIEGLAAGESRAMPFRLKELFPENAPIFQGYPKLRDMSVRLHVQAFQPPGGGELRWRLHKPGTSPNEKGGFTLPRQGRLTEVGSIEIENASNLAALRKTLLHEVNHQIQYLEDFPTGANAGKYREIAEHYRSSRQVHDIMDIVIRHGQENIRGYDDIFDLTVQYLHGAPEGARARMFDGVANLIEEMATKSPSQNSMEFLASKMALERAETEAMLQLRLGNENVAEMREILRNMDDLEVYQRGIKRYLAQGGEADSFIVEFLADKTLQEQREILAARGAGNPQALIGEAIDDAFRQDLPRLTDEEIAGVRPTEEQIRRGKAVRTTEDFGWSSDLRQTVKDYYGWDDSQMEVLQGMVDRDPRLISKLKELIDTGQVAEPLELDKTIDAYIRRGPGDTGPVLPKPRRVEVLENPTRAEFEKFVKQTGAEDIRFITTEDGTYLWDAGEGIHYDIGRSLGLDMDYVGDVPEKLPKSAEMYPVSDIREIFWD